MKKEIFDVGVQRTILSMDITNMLHADHTHVIILLGQQMKGGTHDRW